LERVISGDKKEKNGNNKKGDGKAVMRLCPPGVVNLWHDTWKFWLS